MAPARAPPPEGCAGNPVNITNGNKYQVEHDLITPIPLARHYNGLDGLWRHSYSARITRKDDSYLLYREDGKVSEFTGSGSDLTSITDLGRLSRLPGDLYMPPNSTTRWSSTRMEYSLNSPPRKVASIV
ncbi:DUF6531 domain-containing protein [Pseudomonas aeruginosa]|nr:DUF6531 domain-containing protein [Pseudomonas aeruginosa]